MIERIYWDRMYVCFDIEGGGDVAFALADKNGRIAALPSYGGARFNVTNRGDGRFIGDGSYCLVRCGAGAHIGELAGGEREACAGGSLADIYALSRAFTCKGGTYTVAARVKEDETELIPTFRFRAFREKEGSAGKRAALAMEKAGIRCFFALARLFSRHDGKHVLFASESKDVLKDNLLAIRDAMRARGMDGDYKMMYDFHVAKAMSGAGKLRLLGFLGRVAKADYIFLDDYSPVLNYVRIPKRTKVIQAWHAGLGFKAVGLSRLGLEHSPSFEYNIHRRYDYVVCASRYTARVYAENFGVTDDKLLPVGLPRLDRFLDPGHRRRATERFYEEHPQCLGKKLILFAPTFRGSYNGDGSYDFSVFDFQKLYDMCERHNAVFAIKLHPFDRAGAAFDDELADRVIVLDNAAPMNDLLYPAELLITDYSSNIFEFSLLEKPMLFFAPDRDLYAATRGFHRNYEENAPGKVVYDFDSMIAAIDSGDFEEEKAALFRKEHFDIIDTGASDRVIDAVFGAV